MWSALKQLLPQRNAAKPAREHLDVVAGLLRSPGVEIGAFNTPIPGIQPVHVDRFRDYANERTLAEYYGDSADLPFVDSSLNYVASSHVIEHVANPLKAFLEWYRVLRDGGIIYMTVPHRCLTFDRFRPLTPVDHIVDDYRKETTQSDATHIDEYVSKVDWSSLSSSNAPEKVAEERQALMAQYRAAVASGGEINIHFHTFEPASMVELIRQANLVLPLNGGRIEVLRTESPFPLSRPDGFLVVAAVHKKGPRAEVPAEILRPGARKFSDDPPLGSEPAESWPDEESYLRLNPDVAAAVACGEFVSGFAHYVLFGRQEGRNVR
jgi:SAM-dependent methyltransferase